MDVTALHQKRGVIKSSCTRIKNYVNSITSVTPEVIAQLSVRSERLNEHWNEYSEVQYKLESIDEAAESNDRIQFEEAFYTLSGKIRAILNSATSVSHERPDNLTPSPSTINRADVSDSLSSIRLPKLDLPTFSGKYDDWFPFCDIFVSVIHNNNSLTDTQKFQYLKSVLTGDAADVIHSLELSNQNYSIAWNLLKERYDNKRAIVYTHIRGIFDLPVMLKENIQELRQIADGASKHVRSLKSLKRPTDTWDDLLVYVLVSKLDPITAREWQASLAGTELPTLKQFSDFISHRCQTLEASAQPFTTSKSQNNAQSQLSNKRQTSTNVSTVKNKCAYCNADHPVYFCKEFLKLPVPRRISEIRKRKLCTNCLRSTQHASFQCTAGGCKTCNSKHNSVLHISKKETVSNESNTSSEEKRPSSDTTSTVVTHTALPIDNNHVMLSTALVFAYDSTGTQKKCRVLLDCGSQANFVSQRFLKQLGLHTRAINMSVSGINQSIISASRMAQLKLQARSNSFSATIDCIVSEHITDKLPTFTISRKDVKLPNNIKLADPQFHVPSEIDVLIGADLFWRLLCVGQIKPSANHPTLQKTHFGWILAGRFVSRTVNPPIVNTYFASLRHNELQNQLSKFWDLEQVNQKTECQSFDEQTCERHFLNNVSSNQDGRLIVKLPVKETILSKLGESKPLALRRFYSLERRLDRDPVLKSQYTKFIHEYISLDHMKLVDDEHDCLDRLKFYLPHHCVLKPLSSTTKLRVVFDGSFKSSSGISLNDALMVGPVVQQDLISILMRFRTHKFVFTADIKKMYRQVLIHESQTSLQRILWRDNNQQKVDTYELLTVTYGTASASYLATRSLKYLAEKEAINFPIGSRHVLHDFYVDDILSGADTIQEAKIIRNEVTELLKRGSFILDKWSSNETEILKPIENANTQVLDFNKESDSRILGILWSPVTDVFQFSVEVDKPNNVITKRSILSEISKLFDPLGLLGPIIIIAKLLIQELWQLNIQWDESVPIIIHTRWSSLRHQLSLLNDLKISRCIKFNSAHPQIELHGFCDASQNAYGACVYVRSKTAPGKFRVELLVSKSRVAPLKAVSLPRLELCAALLLSQLIDKVNNSIDTTQIKKFLWSDSTITLNWISSCSRRWTTFVANRVGEIQRLTNIPDWHHVPSQENPADLLSRGLEPAILLSSNIWWHGPDYLLNDKHFWPNAEVTSLSDSELLEQRKTTVATAIIGDGSIDNLIKKHSSLMKICRVVSYCLRMSKPRRNKTNYDLFITPDEITASLRALCKFVQASSFQNEINLLLAGKELSSTSNLLSLSPFIDTEGILRVGGRLRNSILNYSARHPILLPKHHRFTHLIIESEHIRNLHSGVQATIAAVRQRYWPISVRSTTRGILRRCVVCFKSKPVISEAKMGELPAARVTPSRPFSHCGVDYAGPLIIREGRRRNARNVKAYIAIFVCFAVKAVHIELVSDLTSDSFLASLKRFIARRGKPITMYSDNGTNFVGAARQLKEFYEFINQEQIQSDIKQFLQRSEITWNFIPPNAPHFGGLWEAAVKSAKTHLYRIIGEAHLTFEEMQTILCEIESILNSRPIIPLTEDPNDLSHLTPGHFLVGDALNSFPCPDLTDTNVNRLLRWQRVEQIRQQFWKQWSLQYLTQLQTRTKWKSCKGDQLKPGQIVLIKQQGLPPLHWILGRVQTIHSGSDSIIRSATIKTSSGLLTRPLSKIAILPIEL